MGAEPDDRGVAVVGVGAILPDAPDATTFWENVKTGRYSITDVSPSRWDPELYYDPDHAAPDKTYSKIGGWVREWEWDPLAWRLPIPPKVAESMDDAQKWAIACTRSVLEDQATSGGRAPDRERTAVIIGNAMAGERHYMTALRIYLPEYVEILQKSPSFTSLPEDLRTRLVEDLHAGAAVSFPPITEDTMPGELSNVMAGRVANVFNFRGPSFITDAACGSAMAAVSAAVQGLLARDYDAAITGGVDRNMGASSYVKFCKIGALSATGTRPYADGADGFVMGEGAALFLLKRLADAERDGDRIYAVIRGMGGSSDGRGKGITAPNPIGQRLCTERAWQSAGLDPGTASLVEGHGTSTKVGDVVEVAALTEAFGGSIERGSIALGSVKSNIGHLKAAAGGAGLLKTIMAIADGVLPPSINFTSPNPNIDFAGSPFRVNTELRDWERPPGGIRRAGVSAFGFGGTNWHTVLEEYAPRRDGSRRTTVASARADAVTGRIDGGVAVGSGPKAPVRGVAVVGGGSVAEVAGRVEALGLEAAQGRAPTPMAPAREDLAAPERVTIDFADAADLAGKADLARKALEDDSAATWKALKGRGIHRGAGPAPKVAFLYPGQGSQYANMLRALAEAEPIVAETFAEADEVMTPLLGRPLTSFLFVDPDDKAALAAAEMDLMQTAITQPAVLAVDHALTRLLAQYGIEPDMVMGHSLGEYGALIAAGALSFEHALEAVSARGREMSSITVEDNGKMAAVFAPLAEIERIVAETPGNVVIANFNSMSQAVVGGATVAVDHAVAALTAAGFETVLLPVSHAFHTSIVAPASEPMRRALVRLDLGPPRLPIIANVSGEFYPTRGDVTEQMLDILARQVASPVQFVKGLGTLYEAGARVFVEVGPKRALQGFVDDVLVEREGVVSLFTNHPKVGDLASFNQALCGLYAAGLGTGREERPLEVAVMEQDTERTERNAAGPTDGAETVGPTGESANGAFTTEQYLELGKLFAGAIRQGGRVLGQALEATPARAIDEPTEEDRPVVITGAGLGLPGTEHVFEEGNIGRILDGEQFIEAIPKRLRTAMLDKHVTRLVKRENGDPSFEVIDDESEVIKLAGRAGAFDLEEEFGVSADRIPALDRSTQLAIGAGIDALRDAGIPLVLHYRTTSVGSKLPERWELPEGLREDTGVIFASAFPGYDSFAGEIRDYYEDRARQERLEELRAVRAQAPEADPVIIAELDRRIADAEGELLARPYGFDRRFLFRCLSMGHSQFAEIVGARGPNTQVNSACASTTQAIGIAEDWIRAGRCRRVVVIAADDATSDNMMEWIGAGFLASGAAATDAVVEEAATPFDRRRHGMIVGMGAAALVVESAGAAAERGIRPICEVLGAVNANSAFHGSRLDVHHIAGVMEGLVAGAEKGWGIRREDIAPETVFVSHETYTPARGGSAAAEVEALRRVFGDRTAEVLVANTKGFTGHPMGVGIEDVVAVKMLESGTVPAVPNYREVDPDLGTLNLSKGGAYPVRYALRLAAGFGSQIAMTLLRWVPTPDGSRTHPTAFGYEGRIADHEAWTRWLAAAAGVDAPVLEVVQHRLRVRDEADAARSSRSGVAPARVPVPVHAAIANEPAEVALVAAATVAAVATVEAVAAVETVEAVAAVAVEIADPTESAPLEPSLEVAPVDVPVVAPLDVAEAAPADEPEPAPVVLTGGPDEGEVREAVMELVAEATGYPQDMLDPDLDLEADLGVDTVKQAEIFSAIRGRYDIPRDENLKLRDFPTLSHVVGFVMDRAPGAAATAVVAPVDVAEAAPADEPEPAPVVLTGGPDEGEVREAVMELVAEATGYPQDMLDPDLDLEADLGVDTVKQAEIFSAIRGRYDIPRDENLKLRDFPTLSHVVGFVMDRAPGAAATAVVAPVDVAEAAPADEPEPAPVVLTGGPDEGEVREAVMELVAEATGYPQDMLDPDLDLEADLGVDTVKQAEIFSAIRGRYDIPRDENLKLRDFPTLSHVVGFVMDRAPGAAATAVVAPVDVAEAAPADEPEPAPVVLTGGPDEGEVREAVMELVAEATGYPQDMLDPDLDLEADLGVDTVKQAEIFSAIRGRYDIPRDENLKLRDFPTLSHVVGFVMDRAPGAAATAVVAPVDVAEAAPADEPEPAPVVLTGGPDEGEVREAVMELVAEATGYPQDMLDPDLDLEADLGVDTVKQAEIFSAIRGRYDIPRDENLKLRDFPTLSHVVGFVMDRAPGAAATAVVAPVDVAEAAPADEPEPAPVVLTGGPDEGEVREAVMELVAEATGYPQDMLDPDLDLEADLGVDTVKQAEIFSAIRGRYDIPRDENLKLRDFPTLSHVVGFVMDRAPGAAATAPESDGSPATSEPEAELRAPDLERVLAGLEAADAVPRRVAVPVLRPPLDRCVATGVSLSKDSRVAVISDHAGVGKELVRHLESAGADVLLIDDEPQAGDLEERLRAWAAEGRVSGMFWLPALDLEGDTDSLDAPTWDEAVRVRVKSLAVAVRALYDELAERGSFLVAGTRLGGSLGHDPAGATSALGGAVVGFAKALGRELEAATVKAVDVSPDAPPAEVAEALLQEALRDPGTVEVGHSGGLRWTVGLQELPAADGEPGLAIGPDSVFAVTGAAGSIVSAIVSDLARASGGTFHLLDLAPAPDPDDADIELFETDRNALKAALVERARSDGEKPTPAIIERRLGGIERRHAALSAMRVIEASGGSSRYHQVDLTDADAVARVVDGIRAEHGRIDVLLHAAGLEISRLLRDKPQEEFDLVFDVKVDGWANVMRAAAGMPIGAVVAFSSVAGRFGNAGQTDYASANGLLCSSISNLRRTRPETRGIAIDWTAWGGIGMATRGSIPKMMEAAGIDMLPPEAGIPVIRRELVSGGFRGEIVVASRLGVLLDEGAGPGGIDPDAFVGGPQGPLAGRVVSMGVHGGLRAEITLDPTQPFLDDHRIDGTPVLPGVMGIEAFAEAASAALPGWHVARVEDVRFLAPLKCYRDEARSVTVEAVFHPAPGGEVAATCRLVGRRDLPGRDEPQVTTHFTARVVLSPSEPAPEQRAVVTPSGGSADAEAVYRVYFHGPAYRVLDRVFPGGRDDPAVGLLAPGLPANHRPESLPLLAAPRLIELSFQTAGMWELVTLGRFALPAEVGCIRFGARPSADGGHLVAIVRAEDGGSRFHADVTDDAGTVIVSIEDYRTIELPGALDPEALAALRAAVR